MFSYILVFKLSFCVFCVYIHYLKTFFINHIYCITSAVSSSVFHQTDRQTDGRTDGRTDRHAYTCIHPDESTLFSFCTLNLLTANVPII